MGRTLLSSLFAVLVGASLAFGQTPRPMSETSAPPSTDSEGSGLLRTAATDSIDLKGTCSRPAGGCCSQSSPYCCRSTGNCCQSSGNCSGLMGDCCRSTTSCCSSNGNCCGENTDWQGAYVGVHVGAGLDSSRGSDAWTWTMNFPTGTLIGVAGGPLFVTRSPATESAAFHSQYQRSAYGLQGGLDVGYNWQNCNLVYGIEADFSGTTQKSSVSFSAQPVPGIFPPLPNFFFIPETAQGWSTEQRIDWLTTLRGRAGMTIDRSLVYLTGGLAVAEIETDYTLVSSPGSGGTASGNFAQFGLPGGVAIAHFNNDKVGWCLGAGVETKLSCHWSLKVEYLFVDLGRVEHSFDTGLVPVLGSNNTSFVTGSTAFSSSIHVYENIISLGLNYKF
jgi:outer membrane immunogenic protein